MRALWSVVVVCLVAASGAGTSDARSEHRAPTLLRQAPSRAGAPALRPTLHAGVRRVAAPERTQLPISPAALTAAFSLRPPLRRALAQVGAGCGRAAAAPLVTGSARGPPIA
ncbi:MAG TPA: hypothetical protein VGD37_24695 [Kofleriaceae bacterium]